jgi:hypothetical protein
VTAPVIAHFGQVRLARDGGVKNGATVRKFTRETNQQQLHTTTTSPGANDEPMCPFICWDFNLANLFSIIRPEGKEEEEK